MMRDELLKYLIEKPDGEGYTTREKVDGRG